MKFVLQETDIVKKLVEYEIDETKLDKKQLREAVETLTKLSENRLSEEDLNTMAALAEFYGEVVKEEELDVINNINSMVGGYELIEVESLELEQEFKNKDKQ